EVGLGLIGFGISFAFLGVSLFFDRDFVVSRGRNIDRLVFYFAAFQKKLQGYCLFYSGALFLIRALANSWYNLGNIWLLCGFQWLLAFGQWVPLSYSGCWMGYTVSGHG
ncbi:hypothetical protein Gogos_013718, partial [Gossypium gossypioides]|nr:hypothetical protein [Gossypium gossypioides]